MFPFVKTVDKHLCTFADFKQCCGNKKELPGKEDSIEISLTACALGCCSLSEVLNQACSIFKLTIQILT